MAVIGRLSMVNRHKKTTKSDGRWMRIFVSASISWTVNLDDRF